MKHKFKVGDHIQVILDSNFPTPINWLDEYGAIIEVSPVPHGEPDGLWYSVKLDYESDLIGIEEGNLRLMPDKMKTKFKIGNIVRFKRDTENVSYLVVGIRLGELQFKRIWYGDLPDIHTDSFVSAGEYRKPDGKWTSEYWVAKNDCILVEELKL